MFSVSLHGIAIQAARGVYAEEHVLQNQFEVDVDVFVPVTDISQVSFIDYTIIRKEVSTAFEQPHDLLEHFVNDIYNALKNSFPQAEKIKIVIRKLNPPMSGQAAYAQVSFEG